MQQPKILVVTSSFGNGHKQVSKALKSEFENHDLKNVTIIDLYDEAYPTLNTFAKQLHINMFKHAQTVYKWFFYGTEKLYNLSIIDKLLELSGKKIKSILQIEKPDIIVTTFPVESVAKWKKISGHPCKLYTVITDYYIHRSWINDEVDRYYIATEELLPQLSRFGVPFSKVLVSGIPIREEFRKIERSKLIVDEHQTNLNYRILIVAGAVGALKDVKKITQQLLNDERLSVKVVCGNNRNLYKSLINQVEVYNGRLQVFGYVNDIYNLYKEADLLITKPGGITLSESIACSLPTILYRPTPGQESENSRVFENVGASLTVKTISDLVDYVEQILEKPYYLFKMKISLMNLYKGFSSQLIVNDIFEGIS
ncbi:MULTISPECIES: MGDG synthase family glycosyltransferase [Bacillaceae]|uniref:MGDG synthase family glycosyltransferase n=1 Tax=Bacillaceae TaxID=186817 RepID=UPI002570E836|nr:MULTISPECIES: glycosyltransferase [unclassified Bacillus (in: firmicutes)]